MSRWPVHEPGSLLGKRIMVAGPEEGRGNIYWRLHSGLVVPADDTTSLLKSELRQFNPRDFVMAVAAVSARHFKERERLEKEIERVGSHPAAMLRDFQLALCIKYLLGDKERTDWSGDTPSIDDLANLSYMTVGLYRDADRRAQSSEEIWGLLARMAYLQSWDQEDLWFLTRGVIIAQELAKRVAPTPEHDLNRAFEAAYGLSLTEFLFLSFALWAYVTNNPGVIISKDFLQRSPDFFVREASIDRFFKLVSVDFETYRSAVYAPQVFSAGVEPYSVNPLWKWPVIEIEPGQHVVPIPRLVIHRAIEGLYYDFQAMPQQVRSKFGHVWGLAFEEYVGLLMRETKGLAPIPARKYRHGDSEEVSCDWLDGGGVLIECKTRGLSARSKMTGAMDDIRRDITREGLGGSSLAGGVAKLFRVREAVQGRAPGLEPLHGAAEIFCVLVTLDSLYNPNAPYMRELFLDGATEVGGFEEAGPLQVTDIAGFERLCSLTHHSGDGMPTLVKRKLEDELGQHDDFEIYFPKLWGSGRLPTHPIHDSLGKPLLKQVIDAYRRSG